MKPKQKDLITKEGSVTLVENEFTRRQDERRPFELQWRMNVAFIEGNQYLDINPVAMDINEIPKMYDWQEREVFNHIAPTIENRIAKLNRMRPILKTSPGTSEHEDIRAARVGTAVLKNTYYEQGIQNKMSEVYAWLEITGSCLLKNIWDPKAGEIIGYIKAQMEAMEGANAEGINIEMLMEDMEEIREGNIDVIVCPPQEILPDSVFRQNVKNCKSIIHARAYHLDEIEDIFNVTVPADGANVLQLQRSMVGMGGLGYGLGGFQYSPNTVKEHALVKEYWEVPCRDYPKGRLIIVAGGKLIHEGDLPYPVGKDGKLGLPFEKVDCIERPGVFWGKSIVERLIPLQRRYNAIKNRKTEYMNRVAIGGYWVEEESIDLDDMEANAGSPGYIGVVKQGHKYPQTMQNSPLPHTFDQEEQAILNEINILSGVSDLSKLSKAPPGVKSGVALNIATEQDDTRLSTVAANIEVFLTGSGQQWLRLYKHFADTTRTIREVGENNIVEVIAWEGSDIKSDDVIVEPLSAQIDSPGQRRQMVFELLASGLFNDPETGKVDKAMRQKIFEMIQLGNWESGDSTDKLHTSKAERENMSMSNGKPATPASYDDHLQHIQNHNKFRLTVEYEELIAQMPMIEQVFQAHIDGHLFYLVPQQEQPMGGGIEPPQEAPQLEIN